MMTEPVVNVAYKNIIKSKKPEYKWGEEVEVLMGNDWYSGYKYCSIDPVATEKLHVVSIGSGTYTFKNIRKPEKITLTLSQIAEKFNYDRDKIKRRLGKVMKTKTKIMEDKGLLISTFYNSSVYDSIQDCMQEYADQQLAEYRSKLKEQFKIQYLTIGFPSYPELCKLVDITQL